MKKLVLVCTLIILGSPLLISERGPIVSQDLTFLTNADYVANEVLVKFREGVEGSLIQAAIISLQSKIITHNKDIVEAAEWNVITRASLSFIDVPYLLRLKVPDSLGTIRAVSFLEEDPNVEYAEPNLKYHFFVDDEYYADQWALFNDGQTGGTADADIDAPEAWAISTGNPDIIVAVIDTGVDLDHEDLANNIWHNPAESGIQASDDIDNDGNGYTDDVMGWDFSNADNDPTDNHGHGTHVAGIIGAEHNNAGKIKGVCGDIRLMALKCSTEDVAETTPAIYYAANNGVKVINTSWGLGYFSQTLYEAINYARSKGVLFVAAAGNTATFPNANNDNFPVYPASYSLDNIVSVLSTTQDDGIANGSHYGATSVHLGAPGGSGYGGSGDIKSTLPNNSYGYMSGTSMASPYVAGGAALAWGKCPVLTYSQLKNRLINTTDILPALNGKCVSAGRLNLYSLIYDSSSPNGAPDNPSGTPYSWNSIYMSWGDNSSNEIGFDLQRQKPGESEYSSIQSVDSNITSFTDAKVAGGTVYYKIRAYNMAGYSSLTNPISVTIPMSAPAAPSDLTAQDPAFEGHVELCWQDNANNEEVFVVQRRPLGSGIWANIATVNTDPYLLNPTLNYLDSAVPSGTYYYRVKVTNPSGSSYSSQIMVDVEEI